MSASEVTFVFESMSFIWQRVLMLGLRTNSSREFEFVALSIRRYQTGNRRGPRTRLARRFAVVSGTMLQNPRLDTNAAGGTSTRLI